MKTSIIELKKLTKCYGSSKVVNDLSLSIEKGEIFGLLGPNGAGKTTTILMMLGLVEPTSGTATVCGYNATLNPIDIKQKVGYMPDNVGFYDHMTGLENLIYIGELNGYSRSEAKEKALRVLDTVGLGNVINKKTTAYSRGMKQRLGLADVLIKQPEIIILDEPTLGIDPSGVKDFLKLIKQLSREKDLTVLLSSHHLNQVQQVCDRVGIFVEGNLLAEGNIEQLSEKLFGKTSYQIGITLNKPVSTPWIDEQEALQVTGAEKFTIEGNLIKISCEQDVTPDIVRFLVKKNYDIMGVQQKVFGLEDIYQKYFEKQHQNI